MTYKVIGQSRKVTWCVWQVVADTLRTKCSRNTKIGKVAHPMGNNAHQFQGQRSTIKVTRSTNAETGSASYLPTGKAYELQWYTDGVWRPVSSTSAMTSKVKSQGRKVKWCVSPVLAYMSRTKRSRNTKIGTKVGLLHATGAYRVGRTRLISTLT